MKTILFIEDEEALHKTIGAALTDEQTRLVSALNGEIGLRRAQEEKPDLILLDIMMPDINGLDVLRRLKAQESTRDIPVIMMTNKEEMEEVQEAINLGARTYLVKTNYELEDIVNIVHKTLSE